VDNSATRYFVRKFGGLTIFALIWEGVSRSGLVLQDYFPPVTAILGAMGEEIRSPKFLDNLLTTWGRALGGLAIAIVLGIGLAIVATRSQVLRRMLAPFVDMLRVLPPPAIVPISIFAFGIGTKLYLFIVVFAAVWPIYINAVNALAAPEPVQLATARSMGYGDSEILYRVRLPAALPEIFTGIRIGSGLALLAAVAAEMIAASSGLGALLYDAGFTLRVKDMFAIMFFIGISGILLNGLVAAIRRWMIGWHIDLAAMGDHA
jgi:NitT/TauT family transport system permease protein